MMDNKLLEEEEINTGFGKVVYDVVLLVKE